MNLSLSLAVCLTLAALLPAPARAMDGAAFQQLNARVDNEHLSDAKLTLLKTAASTNTFTCAQVARLVEQFSFGEDKLEALSALKDRIEDPENKGKLVTAFSFDDEKEKAKALLAHVQKAMPAAPTSAPAADASASTRVSASTRGSSTGEMTPLLVNQVGAWPDEDVRALVAALQNERFTDGKMKVLQTAISSRPEGFTSAQLQQLVPLLTFSDDMVQAMKMMNDHLLGMTSREVLGVLGQYAFNDDKLKVLRVLKDVITDAENKFIILDEFTFGAHKEEARKILETLTPRSPVYGTIRGKRAIFVVDVSGSMEARFTTNRGESLTRLQFVQRELQSVLKEQLPADAKFNLVVFSTRVQTWKPGLIAATPQSVQEAVQYVGALRQGGGTNIHGALEKAFAHSEVDAIYFLTDGMPTDGKKKAHAEILQDVAAWNAQRKVVVNTVAFLMGSFSNDNKPRSRELMLQLAKATGGVYRAIE
jgi:Mg-chelatase subunit ChlD